MRIKTTMGKVAPLGVSTSGKEIQFAFVSRAQECGVILYDGESGKESQRIAFPKDYRVGDVHTMRVRGIAASSFSYAFYETGEKEKRITDPYARRFIGNEVYGDYAGVREKKAVFETDTDYDWEGDQNPRLSYSESVGYCMHLRGFTARESSKVKDRGTFRGAEEKIPYLKDLGITTVELQPVYEFDEVYEKKREWGWNTEVKMPEKGSGETNPEPGKNYWGYTRGYYYAPKNSYALLDCVKECKDFVKALHKNRMEVILQFYFPAEVKAWEVLDILRFWVLEYHVDGFHIKGQCAPMDLICADPVLQDIKLWYYDFPEADDQTGGNRRYGIYRDDFESTVRRFVKGEEGLVSEVVRLMQLQPSYAGKINYVSNYSGFTLKDTVCYERKHNEANGEENRDGTDYNFSWNCGMEGELQDKNTEKQKEIAKLRLRQMKNLVTILLFSQGMPLFFMGDEFGNSQQGNNNPYCQDNEIAWLDWKDLEENKEWNTYFKNLLALRRAHPVLRQEKQLRQMDYISCGFPDLSYHGEEPWRPEMASYSHQIGILLNGSYVRTSSREEDDSFYIAVNMHWEEHSFILPAPGSKKRWKYCVGTGKREVEMDEKGRVIVPPRSICIFQSNKDGKQ